MTAMWPMAMPRSGCRGGDGAEHVVEAAALDPEPRHLPTLCASEVGDLGDDRAAIAGEDHQRFALAVLDGLDGKHTRKLGERRLEAARGMGDLEPHGVVMTRAL